MVSAHPSEGMMLLPERKAGLVPSFCSKMVPAHTDHSFTKNSHFSLHAPALLLSFVAFSSHDDLRRLNTIV